MAPGQGVLGRSASQLKSRRSRLARVETREEFAEDLIRAQCEAGNFFVKEAPWHSLGI